MYMFLSPTVVTIHIKPIKQNVEVADSKTVRFEVKRDFHNHRVDHDIDRNPEISTHSTEPLTQFNLNLVKLISVGLPIYSLSVLVI